MAVLRAIIRGRPNTPEEENTGLALDRRYRGTTIAAAVLGTTGAALVVTGAVFLATGRRRRGSHDDRRHGARDHWRDRQRQRGRFHDRHGR